jgi:putative addiction module component (TIGR02574 family)
MSGADEILDGALKLPPGERARIARELLASLEDDEDIDADELWIQELADRARQVKAGTAELEDWETVRDEIAANLRK